MITQLENEVQSLKQEKRDLEIKVQALGYNESRNKASTSSPPDKTLIASLNNKIKDASALYDKVKGELKEFKQVRVHFFFKWTFFYVLFFFRKMLC